MANYALTVNPQFTPFTYDELVKPVQAYQEVYNDYDKRLGELQEKSSSLEKLALSAQDQDTYLKYKSYADEVNKQIDNLTKNGLSSATRSGFQNVRKMYNTEITPIEEAIKTRDELIKRQQNIYDKDETALFDRSASDIKLSDIMTNPNLDFQHYSGLKLRSQMEAAMKNFADELNGPMKNVGNAQLKAHYGFTREEIEAAIKNPYDPNNKNVINSIANQVLEGSGILNWDSGNEEINKALQDQAYNYIMQGAYAGIGKDQLVENYYARQKDITSQTADDLLIKDFKDDSGKKAYWSSKRGLYYKDKTGNITVVSPSDPDYTEMSSIVQANNKLRSAGGGTTTSSVPKDLETFSPEEKEYYLQANVKTMDDIISSKKMGNTRIIEVSLKDRKSSRKLMDIDASTKTKQIQYIEEGIPDYVKEQIGQVIADKDKSNFYVVKEINPKINSNKHEDKDQYYILITDKDMKKDCVNLNK